MNLKKIVIHRDKQIGNRDSTSLEAIAFFKFLAEISTIL